LKSLIRLARNLGVEVRRTPNPAAVRNAPIQETAGAILEYIGTKGVGKTTLYTHSLARLGHRWFSRHHIEALGSDIAASPEILSSHRAMLFSRLKALDEEALDAWRSVVMVQQASAVLRESLRLSVARFPRGFALEEGLMKNFTREVLELDPEASEPLWRNRFFIYVRAREIATVVERYQRRIRERRQQGFYQDFESDSDIVERVTRDNEVNDRLVNEAEERGRPVLVVHAEDDFEHSVQRVLAFERTVSAEHFGVAPRNGQDEPPR